jgi:hypothetical protein
VTDHSSTNKNGSAPVTHGSVHDAETIDVDNERLMIWWDRLGERQRVAAYELGSQDPMPRWMVDGLLAADVPIGSDTASEQPAGVSPWIIMPRRVSQLVARRRRGHGHDERVHRS